jgi:hypothetical protein
MSFASSTAARGMSGSRGEGDRQGFQGGPSRRLSTADVPSRDPRLDPRRQTGNLVPALPAVRAGPVERRDDLIVVLILGLACAVRLIRGVGRAGRVLGVGAVVVRRPAGAAAPPVSATASSATISWHFVASFPRQPRRPLRGPWEKVAGLMPYPTATACLVRHPAGRLRPPKAGVPGSSPARTLAPGCGPRPR